MTKLLIFDFDGTISDARALARKNLFRVLDKRGYKYSKAKLDKLLGIKMQFILKALKLPTKDLQEIRKEFYSLMIKDSPKLHDCVSIKPLKELSKTHRLIVVSNSERAFLMASAKKLKVNKLFHAFYGAEQFKTKEQELKHILKKYKIQGNQAVYVGDRFSDVESAKKAGVISIAIHNSCSWSPLKDIIKTNPDFIIHDFYNLKELLTRLQ